MRNAGALLAAVVALALVACEVPRARESAEPAGEAARVGEGVEAAGDGDNAGRTLYEGQYTFGHEANVFQPCASDRTYWVVGDSALIEDLQARYTFWRDSALAEPYAPVYARLRGGPSANVESDGFAAQYDGMFEVVEVEALRGLRAGDCDG
ncbi:MAG: hypothetical protein ACREKM_06025 [Longimicrobiales bacterium]